MTQADIALIGLAVMGQNLVLNMADHGFTVAVYNRTTAVVDAFVEGPAKGKTIIGTHSLEELVAALKRPRRVMLLVKAGQPVDDFIEKLIPLLETGRHHHRRRQLQLRGHDSQDSLCRVERAALRRQRRLRRRGGRAARPFADARRFARGLAPHQADLPGHRGESAGGRSRTARPAATGWARTAPGTSSRWCTTASSTATCRSSPKPISS